MRIQLIRIVTALGLATSIYLVWQHAKFDMAHETAGLCTWVKISNCEAIESSGFSKLAGIPMASFGVLYFLVFCGFLMTRRPATARKTTTPQPPVTDDSGAATSASDDLPEFNPPAYDPFWTISSLLSFIGLLTSIFLALLAALWIKAFCIGCATIYVITVVNASIILGAFGPGKYQRMILAGVKDILKHPRRLFHGGNRGRAFLAALCLLAILDLAVVPWWINREHRRFLLEVFQNQPEVKIGSVPGELSRGSADAPLQIVYFTDFECPNCRTVNRDLEDVLSKYPADSYKLTYKHFPLNSKCNPAMRLDPRNPVEPHPRACDLAAMAQALGVIGRFWEMKGLLYGISVRNFDEGVRRVAREGVVGFENWMARTQSKENLERVYLDIKEGIALHLSGVPAVFINGHYAPSPLPRDLKILIDFEVARMNAR